MYLLANTQIDHQSPKLVHPISPLCSRRNHWFEEYRFLLFCWCFGRGLVVVGGSQLKVVCSKNRSANLEALFLERTISWLSISGSLLVTALQAAATSANVKYHGLYSSTRNHNVCFPIRSLPWSYPICAVQRNRGTIVSWTVRAGNGLNYHFWKHQ